jgi:ABC-type glycerol-3-phosphate transport system permease component
MPIILPLDKRKPKTRVLITLIYTVLTLGAITTVLPFMITVTASLSNPADYSRFSPVATPFFSRVDRFVHGLATYFKERPDDLAFQNRPAHWTTWTAVCRDRQGAVPFAAEYLRVEQNPGDLKHWRSIAADYADFALDYDIRDTFCNYDFRDLAGYLEDEYGQRAAESHPAQAPKWSASQRRDAALQSLNHEWGIPYRNLFDISLTDEINFPMHHVSWTYPRHAKTRAYIRFKDAYRRLVFAPGARARWERYLRRAGVQGAAPWPMTPDHKDLWPRFKAFAGQEYPFTQTYPYALKPQWLKYLDRGEVKRSLGLDENQAFTVADYNRLFGARYARLQDIPFPLPPQAPPALRTNWVEFVARYYPRRLIEIRDDPALVRAYRDTVRQAFKTAQNYNWLMKTEYASIDDIPLPARLPDDDTADLWITFVKQVPHDRLILHSAEAAYQAHLLTRYGSLERVNAEYGWALGTLEEATLPIAQAYTVAFFAHEWRLFLNDAFGNYGMVIDYLFIRGRAFVNTIILVCLTLLATLTVNPMAAYALSRFRLRWSEQILLFLMATMAFPAAVSAIPGFLLMRDLHLLNSFAALILPGLANGMSIFILKGFFDGIPRELYEAATIDGASEWQMFVRVTLPMTTPILAVNSLYAFIGAYGSWEWALLVCQKKEYWTISVWLYQWGMTMGHLPWIMMAAFVFASIPTAIVFISCQKVILRGIVIPSMK